jgi:hypothetical protein
VDDTGVDETIILKLLLTHNVCELNLSTLGYGLVVGTYNSFIKGGECS